MPTVADIADIHGVSSEDVAVLIAEHLQVDLHGDDVPASLIEDLDDVLNPQGARNVPEWFGLAAPDWRTDDEPP